MSVRLSDYDYVLPRELIAQRPLERREDSRMMVLHRAGQKIENRQFGELKTFLQPGDLLVLNDTRVLAARRFSDDGVVEFLFLERLGPARWKCMVTPGRKMRVGATTKIDDVVLRVEEITEDGERIVAFERDVDVYAGGSMPLPPYIGRRSDKTDEARYQTVFAQRPEPSPRLQPGCISLPRSCAKFSTRLSRCTWDRGLFFLCVLKTSPGIECMRSVSTFPRQPQRTSILRAGSSRWELQRCARWNQHVAWMERFKRKRVRPTFSFIPLIVSARLMRC